MHEPLVAPLSVGLSADRTALSKAVVTRTPAPYAETLRNAASTMEECELALDCLIKLGRKAAPVYSELVMTLHKREWRLTWKALKVLKTAGLCARAVGEIIDSIDVVASAPEKRFNLEAALKAAATEAGVAVQSHFHKVMERVWLCPNTGLIERPEIDRSESNATAEKQKRLNLWAEFEKASAQSTADVERQRVAMGVLEACCKQVTDEGVAQVMTNLQQADCARLRATALTVATLHLLDACTAQGGGLAKIVEAIARAALDDDAYLRGEAAAAAGLLLERHEGHHAGLPKRCEVHQLTPAQTATLRRRLVALLGDPHDSVRSCVIDAMEDEFLMEAWMEGDHLVVGNEFVEPIEATPAPPPLPSSSLPVVVYRDEGDEDMENEGRKRRRKPSAAQYRAAYLAKYPDAADDAVEGARAAGPSDTTSTFSE